METEAAQTERAKRDGVYQSGIGMDGGYADDDAPPRKKRAIDMNKKCSACGAFGHSRRTSRQCDFYKQRKPTRAIDDNTTPPVAVMTPQQANEDADELDALDAMPFDEGSDGSDAFFDARDYGSSDNDDDVAITRGMI